MTILIDTLLSYSYNGLSPAIAVEVCTEEGGMTTVKYTNNPEVIIKYLSVDQIMEYLHKLETASIYISGVEYNVCIKKIVFLKEALDKVT